MLKFDKCLRLARSPPFWSNYRFRSGRECPKDCPPSYECKQPPKSDWDVHLEMMRRSMIPKVFQPHHTKDFRVYRNIFLFLCVPAIVCVYINTFCMHTEERKRPKFVELSYMRIRRTPYPWDPVRTLFHNPRYNALPTGYEIEVSEDEEFDPFEPKKK